MGINVKFNFLRFKGERFMVMVVVQFSVIRSNAVNIVNAIGCLDIIENLPLENSFAFLRDMNIGKPAKDSAFLSLTLKL